MSLWSLGPDFTQDDLRIVAELGFDGVEIWAEHPAADRHLAWVADRGLHWGLHMPFHDLNLATPDPVVGDRALEVCRMWLERLAGSGAGHAVVHGGYAWASEQRYEAVERARERIGCLARRAGELGSTLLLENQGPDKLGYTHWVASGMAEWVALLDETGCSACLDVGHLALMKVELSEALSGLGGRLGAVHYSDNDRQADWHLWPDDGEGITRGFWPEMNRVGFAGPVIYEISPYRYSRGTLLARAAQGLRQ